MSIFHSALKFILPPYMALAAPQPFGLGVIDGHLKACPDSPNCVSTFAPVHSKHFVSPIQIKKDISEKALLAQIKAYTLSQKRTKIISEAPAYLHTTFQTFLGWVDDVEFYFDQTTHTLHMRAAARSGHYDFGANHRRYKQYLDVLNTLKQP